MDSARSIAFSLVIPAFNEAGRLPAFLASATAHLSARYPDAFEIVVVDDGSDDDTAGVAAAHPGPIRVLRLPQNCGKGAAVRAGMLAARGALRLFADADGATPIAEELRLVAALEAGHDLAVGSRTAPGGTRRWVLGGRARHDARDGAVVWQVRLHRHWSERLFARLVTRLTGVPVGDTQCGFKLFRDYAALVLFPLVRCDGYAFDVELLALARQLDLRTAEVAVCWREMPGSKVRLVRDVLRMLADVREIRRRTAAVVATAALPPPPPPRATPEWYEIPARKAG